MIESVEMELAGRTLSIETGRVAQQADGAVVVRYGDTVVLVTAVIDEKSTRPGIDFLPLRVDFEEKMYAVGKIPGSFFRREGRPGEDATLTARKIDHCIRPLFPQNLRCEVQVIATPLSVSADDSHDVASLIGASAALGISPIPFAGPVVAVEVGQTGDELEINPSFERLGESPLDLLVATTPAGIIMIELEASQVPEETLARALGAAQEACQPVLELLNEFCERVGKSKGEYPMFVVPEEISRLVAEKAEDRVVAAIKQADRERLWNDVDAIKSDLTEELAEEYPDCQLEVNESVEALLKKNVRRLILEEDFRADGRGLTDVRPLSSEVGFLPRAHGSGLFSRGETQVMTIATLGAIRDQQLVRTLQEPEDFKRFMHHYNFPPYCTGEARPLRGAGRREIGHGALAEKALVRMIPDEVEFPYTIRLVSEVMESNGSTSMASVCGSTLALMDAGVPIRAPVAGISIGLIQEGADRYKLLTDIQGLEDFKGDMDFKVAGTRTGVTAIQLDTKLPGLPLELLVAALEQAKVARNEILDDMLSVLPRPRQALSPYAPRIFTVTVDKEKIGMVIGPGGKMIRKIEEECDVDIDIEDDGTVYIIAHDAEGADHAKQLISDLVRDVEVGEVFTGKVVKTMPFGAFCEIAPGKEGLIHISQLAWDHTERTEDVVKVGDEVKVKVVEVDPSGKVRLSRKALLPRPDGGRRGEGEERGEGGRGAGSRPYFRNKRRH